MNTDFPLFQTALAGIKKSSELWSETTNSTELGYEYDDTRDRAWISKLDIEKSCIKHYIQFVLISFCKIDISKREFGKGEFWGRIHLFTFLVGNGHGQLQKESKIFFMINNICGLTSLKIKTNNGIVI